MNTVALILEEMLIGDSDFIAHICQRSFVPRGSTDQPKCFFCAMTEMSGNCRAGGPKPARRRKNAFPARSAKKPGSWLTLIRAFTTACSLILPPHTPSATDVLISAYGCHLKSAADTNACIALSDEHKAAAWIRVEDLADLTDVPEIYKAAVLSAKRERDLGSN